MSKKMEPFFSDLSAWGITEQFSHGKKAPIERSNSTTTLNKRKIPLKY